MWGRAGEPAIYVRSARQRGGNTSHCVGVWRRGGGALGRWVEVLCGPSGPTGPLHLPLVCGVSWWCCVLLRLKFKASTFNQDPKTHTRSWWWCFSLTCSLFQIAALILAILIKGCFLLQLALIKLVIILFLCYMSSSTNHQIVRIIVFVSLHILKFSWWKYDITILVQNYKKSTQ